jgi:hypothetical protein
MKATLLDGRKKRQGRFACLWRVDDRVMGLDLMADFATATVDGISSALDSSEFNKEGEPSTS